MPSNRSLAATSGKISTEPAIIESTLAELLASGRPLDVLEVGVGFGRALLELAWTFRDDDVTFHGINAKSGEFLSGRSDLADIARNHEIVPEALLPEFTLPYVHFYDAAELHFDDESIDLLYSAVTVRFIERKAEFLEEVCRVLRPGGVALLDINEAPWDYPYSRTSNGAMLTSFPNRFVLRHRDELIPLMTYLQLFNGEQFRFELLKQRRMALKVTKLTEGSLDLRLKLDPELTLPMKDFLYSHIWDEAREKRAGVRTVYELASDVYEQLVKRELIDPANCSDDPGATGFRGWSTIFGDKAS